MKKTIQINIAGVVFYIEDDAYAKLNNYLKSIQAYFANYEGSHEIISDIEARIAEKFLEKDLIDNQNVITQPDVDALITSMGTVADFEALEEEGDFVTASGYTELTASVPTGSSSRSPFPNDILPYPSEKKRIYRDTKRKALGGVLAGIAHYFTIDVTWVRIIFLLFVFSLSPLTETGASGFFIIAYIICWIAFPANALLEEDPKIKKFYRNPDGKVIAGVASGLSAYFAIDIAIIRLIFVLSGIFGAGIIAYIILWVSSPQAHTLTQKMEMKGEPVTLENIETNIKRSINVPDKAPENLLTKMLLFPFRLIAIIFSALGNLLKNLGPVVRILVGVFLLVMGLLLIVAVVGATAAFFGLSNSQPWPWMETQQLGMIARDISPWAGFFGFLALFIPAITVLLLGVSLLANRQVISRTFWLSGLGVWVIGIFGLATAAGTYAQNFAREATYEEVERYTMPDGTLYLDSEELTEGEWQDNVQVDLESNGTDEVRLEKTFTAKGATRTEATENARTLMYKSEMRDSLLVFDTWSTLPETATFRDQRLRMKLFIPQNRPFKMSSRFARRSLNDSRDLQRKYGIQEDDYSKFTFVMSGDEGIVCQDCPVLTENEREEYQRSRNDEEAIDPNEFEDERQGLPAKKINVSDFSRVDISNAFFVTIRQGNDYKVEVSAERERDLDDVEVEVSGDRLKIEFDDIFSNHEKVYVYITMPSVEELEFSGAVQAKVIGFDGVDKLDLSMSGASRAAIDVEVVEMDVDISGACRLDIYGRAENATFGVSGASKIDATNMVIQNADADASGASKIEFGTVKILKSDTSGASKISRQ